MADDPCPSTHTHDYLPEPETSQWQLDHNHDISDKNLSHVHSYTKSYRSDYIPLALPEDEQPAPSPAVTYSITDDAPSNAKTILRKFVYFLRDLSYVRAHVVYVPHAQTEGIKSYASLLRKTPPADAHLFELTMLDKLNDRPSTTRRLCLKLLRDEEDGDFLVWQNNLMDPSSEFSDEIEERAGKMLMNTASLFCRTENIASPSQAETEINYEIDRRIDKTRFDSIQVPRECFLKRAPREVRNTIYYFAMLPDIHYDNQLTIWPYRRQHLGGQYRTLAHTSPSLPLLQVSRSIYQEASEVLYRSFSFGFPIPHKARRFFQQVPHDSLRHIRTIDLVFEADVTLAFLWETLAFRFSSITKVVHNDLDGYHFHELLEDVDKKLRDTTVTINFRFPFARRMQMARWDGCCHFMLCKWMINAAIDAVDSFNSRIALERSIDDPRIELKFKRADNAGFRCEDRSLKEQDHELVEFAQRCRAGLVDWEALITADAPDPWMRGPEPEEQLIEMEISRPPECWCSSHPTTYEEDEEAELTDLGDA